MLDISLLDIVALAALILSVVIHEVAHGAMALRLGDETAKLAGRLTLNPIKHLDLVGSFLFHLFLKLAGAPFILGWAKPVPYDPTRLHKDLRYGPLKVALVGPASNLLVALIIGIIIRAGDSFLSLESIGFLGFVVFLNILLAVFNLLPIPPLDGSKVLPLFLPPRAILAIEKVGFLGVIIILALLLYSGVLGFINNLSLAISTFVIGSQNTLPLIDFLQRLLG